MTDEAQVFQAAAAVIDPELEVPLGDVGMVAGASVRGTAAEVTLAVPITAWPGAGAVRSAIEEAVGRLDGITSVGVTKRTMSEDERLALRALRGLDVAGSVLHGR